MRTRVVKTDQGTFLVEHRVCAPFLGEIFDVGTWSWVATYNDQESAERRAKAHAENGEVVASFP